MDSLVTRVILNNWPRKIAALLIAMIIWLFVNYSLSVTKTVQNIPVRVINLPADKTIIGLLPNGLLNRKITLTLTGKKDVLTDVEPGDLEVLVDASQATQDQWIVKVTKRNLVSLNPTINPLTTISYVAPTEFFIKLSRMITAQIPVFVEPPKGSPPDGWEYLDVWPQKLMQTVSGPEEEIEGLKTKGIDLVFDMKDIASEDLKEILDNEQSGNNEVSYFVPNKWKQITIPFRNNAAEELNDPEARYLHIDFLKKELIPVGKRTPVGVYYPIKYSDEINPNTFPLVTSKHVQSVNDLPYLTMTLYLKDVSRLFLDVIRQYMKIVFVAAPKSEREQLRWSVVVYDMKGLEDTFVALHLTSKSSRDKEDPLLKDREVMLRKRFRKYMHRLSLYTRVDKLLDLDARLQENTIEILSR